jgi:hypothetical protein
VAAAHEEKVLVIDIGGTHLKLPCRCEITAILLPEMACVLRAQKIDPLRAKKAAD